VGNIIFETEAGLFGNITKR